MLKIAVIAAPSKTQYFINKAYTKYLRDAGFEPILITELNTAKDIADMCDGLLLPGGNDIDPIYYGEDNYYSQSSDMERDQFERSVLKAFILQSKKVFGICRGFQLIVREYLGVSKELNSTCAFSQHIQNHSLASTLGISRSQPSHQVIANVDILYGEHFGKNKILFVNSMHHQGLLTYESKMVNQVHHDFNILAYTNYVAAGKKVASTKLIEGIDIPNWKCRGVQWHPEELSDVKMLQEFFKEAKKPKNLEMGAFIAN